MTFWTIGLLTVTSGGGNSVRAGGLFAHPAAAIGKTITATHAKRKWIFI
jgi:hypothetical protein